MITVTSIVGNVRSDRELSKARKRLQAGGKLEMVVVARTDAQRSRMRRRSDRGTDVAITLDDGHGLRHGDVLVATKDRMIIVEYEPEEVLVFEVKDSVSGEERVEVAVRLGHMIGNLHRPVSTRRGRVVMPLQTGAEAENIVRALEPLMDQLEVRRAREVFEPAEGASGHAH